MSKLIQDGNPYMNSLIAHHWYFTYQAASAKGYYHYITYFDWNSQVDRANSCSNYFQNYTIKYCKTFTFVKENTFLNDDKTYKVYLLCHFIEIRDYFSKIFLWKGDFFGLLNRKRRWQSLYFCDSKWGYNYF